MILKKLSLALVFGAAAAVASGTAFADRGRAHFGFYFGVPVWGPAYYPAPYYPPYYYPPYYPPTVVVPASPPTYVEQPAPQIGPAPSQAYWYYCPESKSYYPYVKDCPGGWQRVSPQPPAN